MCRRTNSSPWTSPTSRNSSGSGSLCGRLVRVQHSSTTIREVFNDETSAALGPDEKGQAIESVIIEPEMEQEILAQTPYRAPDEARSGAKMTDTSLLIYTSGTTGLPKAANVSWAKPISGVKLFSTLLGLKPTDRYLTALPLYHSSGSLLGVLQVLGPGCTVSGCPPMVKSGV